MIYNIYVCEHGRIQSSVCMYACVKRKHSFVSVCVLTCWHLSETERGTLCTKKKRSHCSLIWHFKTPASGGQRKFYENRPTVQQRWQTQRETGWQRDKGEWEGVLKQRDREGGNAAGGKSIQRTRERRVFRGSGGEEGLVQFHWFEPVGGESAGTRGDRAATVRKWLYIKLKSSTQDTESERQTGKKGRVEIETDGGHFIFIFLWIRPLHSWDPRSWKQL